MSVGLCSFPEMYPVNGIQIGTACAGIKQTDRDDLTLIKLAPGSALAAVFTQNAFAAAPVVVARDNFIKSNPQWLLVNSGNANAGNGKKGIEDALSCCRSLVDIVGGNFEQVLPFSTGVIGEKLPVTTIVNALPQALRSLSESGWKNASEAILTTDTRPKGASIRLDLGESPVIVTGICKGAGMIHPNMATMLSFIATDARIDRSILQECLQLVVEKTFNAISVDGDTSTNDACVLIATRCSGAPEITRNSPAYEIFLDGLFNVCNQLSQAIVRDGEGATKLMKFVVAEATNTDEARIVANTVAQSSLVKTAFFAADPNWGRILAAVGRAGIENFDISRVCIWLGNVCIVENGERSEEYTEHEGNAVMAKEEITIRISLGRGKGEYRMLSCDLSYDYVRINAEYRT